jgi:hypothetical protein
MTPAERILKLMKARGVPHRKVRSELAALCVISPQAVGDWFKEKTKKISSEYLVIIADRYDTTLEWLVTGKGEMDRVAASLSHDQATGQPVIDSNHDKAKAKQSVKELWELPDDSFDGYTVLALQKLLARLESGAAASFAKEPEGDPEK